jgi:molybdopterin molybdotransferase
MPEGADAVVMIESAEENRAAGTVLIKELPASGQNVRRRGEDRPAGAQVLEPGAIVRAVEIAALSAVGRTEVSVVRAPHAAVISTGDEIVDSAAVPQGHQIRDSNAKMLIAHMRSMNIGVTDLGIVPDEPAALAASIGEGLRADVLVLSGGVSVGAYDFVERALLQAGCEVLFHSVSMRPGKPILAAKKGGCLVFGLPGNPVSAYTSFRVFVVPALRKLMGFSVPPIEPLVKATLESELRRRPGRLTYHLAVLRLRDGAPVVAPVKSASSGDVLALVRANAFIVAPGDPQPVRAGREVDVLPWD